MKYLRTFIALPVKVDKQFLTTRDRIIQKLDHERISWVDPANYHVTLRFLGDIPEDKVNLICQSMCEMKTMPEKAHIPLGCVASFGPRKKPRVLWLGFAETQLFADLKSEVDLMLEKCGVSAAEQPFRAHLTLGRIRGLRDIKGYYTAQESFVDGFSGALLFDKVVFYKSVLGPGGPVYTQLTVLPLPDQPF